MSKANKRRLCPAIQREISSSECGENRNSQYRCPPSCSFNPLAPENYAQVLEAEGRLDDLSVRFLTTEPVHSARILRVSQNLDWRDESAVNSFFCFELFIRKD